MVPNGLNYLRWSLVGRDGLGWSSVKNGPILSEMVTDEIIPVGQIWFKMVRDGPVCFKIV